MAKSEMTKKEQSTSMAVPSFVGDNDARGTEDVSKVMTPPRLYVVQTQTQDDTVRQNNKPGDVVLMPDQTRLYRGPEHGKDEDTPVSFTPILFFREWVVTNPFQMRQQLPFIRERSLDPESDIAKKAASQATWSEPCPEDPSKEIRYMQSLVYMVVLHGHGTMLPCIMSFMSAEVKTGRRLSNLIMSRTAPIYTGRYTFRTAGHSNSQGNWFGFELANDNDNPWVDEDAYNLFKVKHEELKAKVGSINVDYEAGLNGDDAPADYKSEAEMAL